MNSYIRLFCMIMLAMLPLVSFGSAKDVIDGYVQDQTGQPLMGVEVGIKKTRFKASTNDKGFYAINYAPGPIQLTFSKEGYRDGALSIEIQAKSYFPAENVTLQVDNRSTSPDQLVDFIIKTMRSGSRKSFELAAIPTKQVSRDFLRQMAEANRPEVSEEEEAKAMNDLHKKHEVWKQKVLDSWSSVYRWSGVHGDGLNWTKVSYTVPKYKIKEDRGFKSLKTKVEIKDREATYYLKIDCVFMGGKWYLGDPLSLDFY